MNAHNLDKLPPDALPLIKLIFEQMVVGWTNCYMVEVKLDNPIHHLEYGGPGLKTHGGSGSRDYAEHLKDNDWAVVHVDDEDWKALDIKAADPAKYV